MAEQPAEAKLTHPESKPTPSAAGQTILVTGLRGFTGQYLASRLRARGAQVIGLVQGDAQNSEEIRADPTMEQTLRWMLEA
jgi:nucleoside-diphosphate-sugar epimerase